MPLKNKRLSTKNAFADTVSCSGYRLKLLNSKSGCKVSVLHLLLNKDHHQLPVVQLMKVDVLSSFVIRLLNPVPQLQETERLFRSFTPHADS